jgi:hypothetical protein
MAGNLAVDLKSAGEWLFRQGELILGPIKAQQVVDKLFTGELTGRTEVSPLGEQRFLPIAEVDVFKVHLAKAEAKLRVEAAAKKEQAKVRTRRTVVVGIVGAVAIVCAAGAAVAARYFAVHNPFKGAEEEDGISVSPPQITLARAHKRDDEELLEYQGQRKPEATSPTGPSALASRTAPGGGTKPASSVPEEPDGLVTAQFDQAAINSVVASNQRKLFTCFREEAGRNPQFAATIPLEFVIGNNGRVAKLWIDNPSYKTGPMADCLLRELQKWPFKPYEGEQATVALSFTIGRRG